MESEQEQYFKSWLDWLYSLVHRVYVAIDYLLDIFVRAPTATTKSIDLKSRKNYAEATSGASILQASKGIVNKNAILSASTDTYLSIPDCCSTQEEFVIVNLSDDLQVDTIIVSNREDFSASLATITVQGSIDYPTDSWYNLGTINTD